MLKQSDIDEFREHVKSLGLKFPVAAIAKATGVSKGNVSDYMKGRKDPSENFLKKFYSKFPKGTQNVPREVGFGQPLSFVNHSKEDKYLRLLEDNDQFFKNSFNKTLAQIAASLDALVTGQRSLQANVDTGFLYQIEREAGKNPAKAEEMKREYDKRFGARMGELIGKDIIDGK